MESIQHELNEFQNKNVWTIVKNKPHLNPIGVKLVLQINIMDGTGIDSWLLVVSNI